MTTLSLCYGFYLISVYNPSVEFYKEKCGSSHFAYLLYWKTRQTRTQVYHLKLNWSDSKDNGGINRWRVSTNLWMKKCRRESIEYWMGAEQTIVVRQAEGLQPRRRSWSPPETLSISGCRDGRYNTGQEWEMKLTPRDCLNTYTQKSPPNPYNNKPTDGYFFNSQKKWKESFTIKYLPIYMKLLICLILFLLMITPIHKNVTLTI